MDKQTEEDKETLSPSCHVCVFIIFTVRASVSSLTMWSDIDFIFRGENSDSSWPYLPSPLDRIDEGISADHQQNQVPMHLICQRKNYSVGLLFYHNPSFLNKCFSQPWHSGQLTLICCLLHLQQLRFGNNCPNSSSTAVHLDHSQPHFIYSVQLYFLDPCRENEWGYWVAATPKLIPDSVSVLSRLLLK